MNLGREVAKEFLFFLLEISDAAKEAKRQGLTYAQFGRWKDKTGKVVAKTEKGQLVPVDSAKSASTKSSTKPAPTVQKKVKPKKKEPTETGKKALIGIYSGRFQPFGQHHWKAFNQLRQVTGANTFIATSNVTDSNKSPFSFQEKKKIIAKYGVPAGNIVQVKSPYNPVEITKRFDPETTALVVIFGAKDTGRLADKGGYYRPLKDIKNLEGYEKHGYYIVAKHESVKAGGKELSGTTIRKILGSRKIDRERKKKLFKKIFGWYDPKTFDLVTGRLESTVRESIQSNRLLLEGGAYGHMAHPFDDMQLTFGDLKNIIRLSLQGHLDKEAKVMEKLDGQALSISWKDGKLIAARNKGHLKNHGANALDTNGIKQMFAGRGALTDAFGLAMDDLSSAISSLSEKQRKKIFKEGQNFMAVEVVFPKTKNVVPYDTSMLVFHGVISYDTNGLPIGENREFARMLAGMIKQTNQSVQRTFTISQPTFLTVPKHQDFSVKQSALISKIDALKSRFKLKDSDTMSVYHQSWWEVFVSKKANSMNFNITNDILVNLVRRWAFNDKSENKNQLKKDIDHDKFRDWFVKFDGDSKENQIKQNMLPFEKIFLELGTEVLKNASGYLAANPNKSVQSVRKSVERAINQLKSSTDISQLNKLKIELERIKSIGGFDAIVPSEGLVFMYKGKIYKLTGSFAPINQILGMIRYGN